jgi:hypothetical protein
VGVEDREWFREARAERLRKAFGDATPRQMRHKGRRRVIDRQILAGVAILLSAGATLALGAKNWWRTIDFGLADVPAVVELGPQEAFPTSGTVNLHEPNDYSAGHEPFVVRGAGGETRAVVRVRRWEDGSPVATGFVAGDGHTEILLRPGRYRVSVAYGRNWRGLAELFGRETLVEEIVEPIDVVSGMGQTLSLRKTPTGNTPTEGRRRAAF